MWCQKMNEHGVWSTERHPV